MTTDATNTEPRTGTVQAAIGEAMFRARLLADSGQQHSRAIEYDACAECEAYRRNAVEPALEAIAAVAERRGRRTALEEVEDQHDCCTTGCGAVAFDGDRKGFCPTCLLCQDLLAALDEEEST